MDVMSDGDRMVSRWCRASASLVTARLQRRVLDVSSQRPCTRYCIVIVWSCEHESEPEVSRCQGKGRLEPDGVSPTFIRKSLLLRMLRVMSNQLHVFLLSYHSYHLSAFLRPSPKIGLIFAWSIRCQLTTTNQVGGSSP